MDLNAVIPKDGRTHQLVVHYVDGKQHVYLDGERVTEAGES